MSTDQFVQLPSEILAAGSQKFEIINLLGALARFALPGAYAGNTAERDLETRFSGLPTIGLPDAAGWLAGAGVKLQSLDSQIAAITAGDIEPLLQALQEGNDGQGVQLLAVNDSSKLIEMEDTGEEQLTPRPMSRTPDPCLLLRLGYNVQNGYAYYAASLPGDSRRPVKIPWGSVVAAGVNAAVAILPPAKTVEAGPLREALHIMEQALSTARAAHATIMAAVDQQPGRLTEQVV